MSLISWSSELRDDAKADEDVRAPSVELLAPDADAALRVLAAARANVMLAIE